MMLFLDIFLLKHVHDVILAWAYLGALSVQIPQEKTKLLL